MLWALAWNQPAAALHAPCLLQVKPGEHVRVVGQPRVLGEWDIGRAPKLDLVAPNDDLWAGTVDGLVTGAPFPFKWVQQLGGAAQVVQIAWGTC